MAHIDSVSACEQMSDLRFCSEGFFFREEAPGAFVMEVGNDFRISERGL